MKDYQKCDIFNADETSVFYEDLGRSSFAPQAHVGRLVKNDKKRVSALIYCNANGEIAHRPALIDFNFPTGSKVEMKNEIKKETRRTVKGKNVTGMMHMRKYKE